MELYLNSILPEKSYFICIAVCAICGYINTAIKVFEDKVNKDNIDVAIHEFEEFCKMMSGRDDIFYGTNRDVLLSV